jgi:hypothetical protein
MVIAGAYNHDSSPENTLSSSLLISKIERILIAIRKSLS